MHAAHHRSRTTGEALLDLLGQFGVEHIFGIPGVHTIELYRGFAERDDIRHVLAKHEQGAGFMADGYARASGKPGVCFFITGPGITNAITAIAQAYSDSVPMLVIASTNPVGDLGRQRGRLHETRDQRAILEPVTAFAATAFTPRDVEEYVNRAFAVFNTRRPRPVYIEIPIDVLAMPAPGEWKARVFSARPAANAADIDRAARLLTGAKRPLIVCGGGARGAAGAVATIARTLAAPLFCTIAAKGMVAPDDPLFLDATLHLPAARSLFAEADVVLAIGTEFAQSEMLTYEPMPAVPHLIRIDIDHEQLCDQHGTTLPILADAALAVPALAERIRALKDRVAPTAAARQHAAAFRAVVHAGLGEVEGGHRRALALLHEALPADTLIATDMTMLAYTGNFTYPLPVPGRWLHPVGYGALGYALPAAIGAQIAAPGRQVVALVGDGGFQFTLPELAVLGEKRLPLLVVVWNNGCFGMIKAGMLRHEVAPVGVDYTNPDFFWIARAYGIDALVPASIEEAAAFVRKAAERNGPALIELSPQLFGSCAELS